MCHIYSFVVVLMCVCVSHERQLYWTLSLYYEQLSDAVHCTGVVSVGGKDGAEAAASLC